MAIISINILTKNRSGLLGRALESVKKQNFTDFEVVLVNDGSTDDTNEVIKKYTDSGMNIVVIEHQKSVGITISRQQALEKSQGDYIVILDDDDVWIDAKKLEKELGYLKANPETVLVGGGMEVTFEGRKQTGILGILCCCAITFLHLR